MFTCKICGKTLWFDHEWVLGRCLECTFEPEEPSENDALVFLIIIVIGAVIGLIYLGIRNV